MLEMPTFLLLGLKSRFIAVWGAGKEKLDFLKSRHIGVQGECHLQLALDPWVHSPTLSFPAPC